jgi:hypothetical protein
MCDITRCWNAAEFHVESSYEAEEGHKITVISYLCLAHMLRVAQKNMIQARSLVKEAS